MFSLVRGSCRAGHARPVSRRLVVYVVVLCACGPPYVHAQREGKAKPSAPSHKPTERKARARGWERVSQEGLSSAVRSAREDAMEALARRVSLLRISGSLRVQDFVRQSPALPGALREPFAGVTFSRPRYSPDQICTVRARVSVADVIGRLKLLNRRHGGGRFNDRDFDRIRSLNAAGAIEVVGQGVPSLSHVPVRHRPGSNKAPAWTNEIRRATGVGRQPASRRGTPAGRLMAVRRARAGARRTLAEQLRGLPMPGTGKATVGSEIDRRADLVDRFDEWLNNARIVETTWRVNGDAVANVEVELSSLWNLVAPPAGVRRTTRPDRSPVARPEEHKGRARSCP